LSLAREYAWSFTRTRLRHSLSRHCQERSNLFTD